MSHGALEHGRWNQVSIYTCITSPLKKAGEPAVKLCWRGKVETLRNVLAFQFWFNKIKAMLYIYTALNTL